MLIVSYQACTEFEQLAFSSFHKKLKSFEKLSNLIENVKAAMRITTHGKTFSKNLLQVEVLGFDWPHLTIIDLSRLIYFETKQQSVSDIELVQEVIQSYIKQLRNTILAVVLAKNDYANQIMLKLACAADKKGKQTISIIAKPNILITDFENKAMYVSLQKIKMWSFVSDDMC